MRIRIEIEADSAKELLSELSKIVGQNSVDEEAEYNAGEKDEKQAALQKDENQEALQEEAKAEKARIKHNKEVAAKEKEVAEFQAERAKTTELGAKHLMTEITAQIMEKGREHGKQIKAWITDEYEVSKASEVPQELRDEFLAKLEAL